MRVLVATMLLVPTMAFGQTVHEKYQEARALEFQSDRETGPNQVNDIAEAFRLMAEAATADPKYVADFVRITRKMLARFMADSGREPDTYYAERFLEVGRVRADDLTFRIVAREFANVYQKKLSRQSFVPGKPIVQVRRERSRSYCNVLYFAEPTYKLLQQARAVEATSWGKYVADTFMTTLRGCGGEGTDLEPEPYKAFPIYEAIKDHKGMFAAGKMAGDQKMFDYVFGAYEYNNEIGIMGAHRQSGYRPFFDQAMRYYRQGGVSKTVIRETILRHQRTAEKYNNQPAVGVAKKTLQETF